MLNKPKANSVISARLDGETIVFQVRGKSAEPDKPGPIVGETKLDLTKVATGLHRRAEIHGWIQRISDAAAISRDPKTGQPATAGTKLEAMSRLVDHYMTGSADWSPTRSRAIGTDETLLARTLQWIAENEPKRLARLVGKDRTEEQVKEQFTAEYIREKVAGWRSQERTALLTKFKDVADMLRAESATDVDAEALLKDL
jgi:hypothetical protein